MTFKGSAITCQHRSIVALLVVVLNISKSLSAMLFANRFYHLSLFLETYRSTTISYLRGKRRNLNSAYP